MFIFISKKKLKALNNFFVEIKVFIPQSSAIKN